MKTQKIAGVYCLANDKVLDWLLAFIESLQEHEPERKLVIIPFDDNIEQITRLSKKYKFEIFNDPSLKELDKIGATLCPNSYVHIHNFRKFAVFWGRLEHFLFLDSDIVILSQLEELFQAYLASGCDFLYSGTSSTITLDAVYKPGSFRDKMISDYSAKGFNAGSFLSSKNLLSLAEVKKLSEEALLIKEGFTTNGEQPFLNYCIDIKQLKTKGFADIIPDLCQTTWAKHEPIVVSDNVYRLMTPTRPDFGKRLPFIHWAGIKCNPYMPNREIFLRYRLKSMPLLARFKYKYDSLYKWGKPKAIKKLSRS